jgi:DNA-binding transcriptional MerR regulator
VDDDGLSAGVVARRLGIAVTTLRTWHQRYGLGPTRHLHGHHRRYGDEDLARLEVMRRLTTLGVPAAEAARIALRDPSPAVSPVDVRPGGGHVVPLGRAEPGVRGLAAAAMRLDTAAVRALLDEAVAGRGVVRTWDELLRPVLVGIGARHASTHRLIEVEHLLSRCVSEVLGAVPRPGPGTVPRILLACADEEQHSLPVEALAAALAERGVACRLLGARVPPRALHDAVRRTGPAGVLVWSQRPQTAAPEQLAPLVEGHGRPAVVAAAGPGWRTVPAGVTRPASLDEALDLTTSVSG